MDRQMFRNGGVVRMQEGGMAPMMPSASPTIPSMPVDPNSVDLPQAAQYAMQSGIDPQAIESMLGQYASQMQDLDNAEDYETVINGIRGDDLPIEARYQELAQIVGPEDSQATPESVLALVQPVMLMAAVDQGIGGLAQDQMAAPVEGAMAEGIMSTVDMGAAEAPNPVNFNQGGPVQYMAAGGPPSRQQALFDEQRELYRQLIDPAQQANQLQEQKDMTQAQMLFDIAQGGLLFASGAGKPGATPAEQLAASFVQPLGNIGARAGEFQKYKDAQAKENRALDLAALQSSGSLYAAERQAELTAAGKDLGDSYRIQIRETDEDGNEILKDYGSRPLNRGDLQSLEAEFGKGNIVITPIAKPSGSPQSAENFILRDGSSIAAIPGTARYVALVEQGAMRQNAYSPDMIMKRDQVTLNMDITIGNRNYPAGSSPNFSQAELNAIAQTYGADAYREYEAPINDRDYWDKFRMTKAQFDALPASDRQFLQGLPVLTDRDYFTKFGMTKDNWDQLELSTRNRLLGVAPEYEFRTVDTGGKIDILRIDKNDPNAVPVSIYDTDKILEPDYMVITTTNADGVSTRQLVDVNSTEGQNAIETASNTPNFTLQKIGTESVTPRGFYVPADPDNDVQSGVYTSYDGRTVTMPNGTQYTMPSNAFEVSSTTAYEVMRNARISANAAEQLNQMDNDLVSGMTDMQGQPLSSQTQRRVRDALREAREGTGFWSKVYSGLDGVLGGVISPEYFGEMFADNQDSRQYIEMVRVFGRSALSASPRFAVADLETTAQLFPDERAFFRNPVSEARKLSRLAEELRSEKARILSLQASGTPLPSDQASTLSQKLFEIDRLEKLLGPILTLSNTANQGNIQRAQDLMNQAVTGAGN